MQKILSTLVALLFPIIIFASGNFDFNTTCQKAYLHLMALQNEEANILLQNERQQHPQNLMPLFVADYGDCLYLLFNGNPLDFKTLEPNANKRIALIEEGDHKSPWYRFAKANIYFHWALIHLRFGAQLKAATSFRKSFILLRENKELFPHFAENNVLLGLEEALAGAIPEQYQWIGTLFGVKGNVGNGIQKIAGYLNTNANSLGSLQEEAIIYYVYLKFYFANEQETAWNYLKGAQCNENNNLMRCFIKANIALNYRKAADAYTILQHASSIKQYPYYPILQYEMAEALLYKLDFNCLTYYQRFIQDFKGQHFIKDAWLKMAWVKHLQYKTKEEEACLQQVKSKGNNITDADKQAYRFANKPSWPIRSLMVVRLYIDGGMYTNALASMQRIDKKELLSIENTLEYNFRYGRIFEELGKTEQAFAFYNATINEGRARKEYFAARASLQKGFILEKGGNKAAAISAFKDCLSMRQHDAQSSIDQLAKAGLNRLGAE
jgi:hypothetical protein